MIQGWTEVCHVGSDSEAELIAGTLRAQDLDAQVFSQKDHAHMISVAGMAIVRVLVPAAQYEAAIAVVEDLRQREDRTS